MTATQRTRPIGLFPLSDQFPMTEPAPAEHSQQMQRPFGLQFATRIATHYPFDMADVSYDDERQVSMVRRGQNQVPLSHTSMPLTVTSTGQVGQPNYDEIFDKN